MKTGWSVSICAAALTAMPALAATATGQFHVGITIVARCDTQLADRAIGRKVVQAVDVRCSDGSKPAVTVDKSPRAAATESAAQLSGVTRVTITY